MSEEKIETCFICGKEFDMNKADLGYYRNGKYPICDFCADFYRFYNEDLTSKKEKFSLLFLDSYRCVYSFS